MSGYLIGLFWNNGEENFDFAYNLNQNEMTNSISVNTSQLTNDLISTLKNKPIDVEIHNIHINKLNSRFCELNIESILFNRCKINSLSALKIMKSLKKITFIDSEIKEIGFENSDIDYISAYCSSIPFEEICNFTSLSELYYKSSRNIHISNECKLEKLQNLQNLAILNLSDNNIKSIDGFPVLPRLISLDLSQNHIEMIDPLGEYKTLKYVYLNNNNIVDAIHLRNNPIIFLNLSHNKISNAMFIESYEDLKSLNVKDNPIKIMPNLLSLKNLDYDCLRVDWNNVNELKGMKGFELFKNIIKSLTK